MNPEDLSKALSFNPFPWFILTIIFMASLFVADAYTDGAEMVQIIIMQTLAVALIAAYLREKER